MIRKTRFRFLAIVYLLLLIPIFSYAYISTSVAGSCVSVFLKNGKVEQVNLLRIATREVRYKPCGESTREVSIFKNEDVEKIVFDENFAKKSFKFTKSLQISSGNVAIIGKNASILFAKIQKISIDSVFYTSNSDSLNLKIARKDIFFIQFQSVVISPSKMADTAPAPITAENTILDSCAEIRFTNGAYLQGKLIGITNERVKIKRCDENSGVIYEYDKEDVESIAFQKGTKEENRAERIEAKDIDSDSKLGFKDLLEPDKIAAKVIPLFNALKTFMVASFSPIILWLVGIIAIASIDTISERIIYILYGLYLILKIAQLASVLAFRSRMKQLEKEGNAKELAQMEQLKRLMNILLIIVLIPLALYLFYFLLAILGTI